MAARGPFGVLLQAQRRAQTSSRAFGDSREPANRALGFLYRKRRCLFYPLFVLAAVAVLVWWAYSPSLPAETLKARYTNSDSKFIDIGGAETHMRDQGNPDGIPLLLIHGAGGSLHEWEGWVDELKSKARLISVDLPGHGLTGSWPRNEYTVEAYADFIELLVDKLKLDRFATAGQSLGGAVAWTFAARQPDPVTQGRRVDAGR